MAASSSSIARPSQPTQPSRKGKRAWRKNVDISTVESGLDSLREEIIQGGPVAEKPSSELFTLDAQGSEEIDRKYKLKEGRKGLKVDEILARRSKVPGLEHGKNKRAHSVITDGVLDSPNKRQKKDWVSKNEVRRLKNNLDKTSHLDVENIDGEVSSFDLWADPPTSTSTTKDTPSKPETENEYIPAPRSKVAPPTIRLPPIAQTATGKPAPAISHPTGGTSYNPSFEDWDALLTEAGEAEVAAEKARQRASQLAAEKELRIQALAAQADADADEESAWEGFETENEIQSEMDDAAENPEALKKKRPQRKTPAQRNKLKRRREAERLARHELKMGQRTRRDEELVRALLAQAPGQMKEASTNTAAQLEETARTDDTGLRLRLRRRAHLGPLSASIPDQPLELTLPDELQDSLRRLKPEGNLLVDRYRGLLVNGKLEARKPVLNPKKRKVKVTEKWAYKDFRVRV